MGIRAHQYVIVPLFLPYYHSVLNCIICFVIVERAKMTLVVPNPLKINDS